ncbi:MAG: glycosyltransferase [Dysgonomonas sp.]
MKLYFYTEDRYVRGKDGKVYNPQGKYKYNTYQRYLSVFSQIVVVARILCDSTYNGEEKNLVEGHCVSVYDIPYYIGPREYLKVQTEVKKKIEKTINNDSAYILRVPGRISQIAGNILHKKKIKYAVEVVGDPYDVFSKGASTHPLRVFFRYHGYFSLKKTVKNATTALYVTEKHLQNRYPNRNMCGVSDVSINEIDIINEAKRYKNHDAQYTLVTIGTLDAMYKAPDIVLKVLQELNMRGYKCRLKWIGAGRLLDNIKRLSIDLNINDKVDFLGYVSDKIDIFHQLDSSDYFILASRQEGLPRVIPEAFARALPVIGTKVGGIPELLQKNMLVDVNSSQQITEKIMFLIDNPAIAEEISKQNLEKGLNFTEDVLQKRRVEFYSKVLESYNIQ